MIAVMTENNPYLHTDKWLQHLSTLPPLERIAAADAAHATFLKLSSLFAQQRHAALTEAHVQGLITLQGTVLHTATKADRRLFAAALRVLQGLQPAADIRKALQTRRATIDLMCVTVRDATARLTALPASEDDATILNAALRRAHQVLGNTP